MPARISRIWPAPRVRIDETIWIADAPHMIALTASIAVCTPPVTESDALVSLPDRIASQRSLSSSSVELGEVHLGHDLEVVDVDVRLEEAVEEHEAVRPCCLQPLREVRQRRVEGRELEGNRDADAFLDLLHHLHRDLLDVLGRNVVVDRNLEDIELDRVGAHVLRSPSRS